MPQQKQRVVQAVIFKKRWYTPDKARSWLSRHNYIPIKRVHITSHYLRYRIKEPYLFESFFMINANDAGTIKLVIGYMK